ncbi:glutamine--fructose-6-phosphate transaminase (isomerizing) [Hyphomicrobiales bacterium]|nr:glutamine--fructose-6-phosphate transaminase (isomerizing) [Hyphomicrobiales bacterium]
MCGIIGIASNRNICKDLLDTLNRLSYRGYDSAGISIVNDKKILERKIKGKISNLENLLELSPIDGALGIGHTRWATHGKPTTLNAHPHTVNNVSLVHNGIIENFQELKNSLLNDNTFYSSDTDTEIISHLIDNELKLGKTPIDSFLNTVKKLSGAFAIVAIFKDFNNLIIAGKRGSPLVIGYNKDEKYICSDVNSLTNLTKKISYLEDGDTVILNSNRVKILDENLKKSKRSIVTVSSDRVVSSLSGYDHFMQKEIFEQPDVLSQSLAYYMDFSDFKMNEDKFNIDFSKYEKIVITGCGTAYYAGMVSKYWFENIAKINIEIDYASELRYRNVLLNDKSFSLFISQSGETADTLAALKFCKDNGQTIVSIVNEVESSIAKESDLVLPIFAGPEIGVASTKAFTCQLVALASLALHIAKVKNIISIDEEKNFINELLHVPKLILDVFEKENEIKKLAKIISKSKSAIFIGRGTSYPIALEGALKLKEISYIHAEGIAAGELKHGAIALVDKNMPVIVLAPEDLFYVKTLSNMHEVISRGGNIIFIGNCLDDILENTKLQGINVETSGKLSSPIIMAVPLQLLAYHVAKLLDKDIDQPRNLAKSVTVE